MVLYPILVGLKHTNLKHFLGGIWGSRCVYPRRFNGKSFVIADSGFSTTRVHKNTTENGGRCGGVFCCFVWWILVSWFLIWSLWGWWFPSDNKLLQRTVVFFFRPLKHHTKNFLRSVSATSPWEAYSCPIGSMVLVYILTWLGDIYGIHVTIYSSTMDPSWVLDVSVVCWFHGFSTTWGVSRSWILCKPPICATHHRFVAYIIIYMIIWYIIL